MEQISQQIHTESPVPARESAVVQKPVAAKGPSAPAAKAPITPRIATTSGTASTGKYPIPIDPGEIPPIPLDLTEWNPMGMQEGESPTPEEGNQAAISSSASAPVSEIQPEMQNQPSFTTTSPPSATPIFDTASEYDFENDDQAKSNKVVIPEQDSMASALKALGWEEEDESK
jgi:hypothetical protein